MRIILAITVSAWFITSILSLLFYGQNISKIVTLFGFIVCLVILCITIRETYLKKDYIDTTAYLIAFSILSLILSIIFFNKVSNIEIYIKYGVYTIGLTGIIITCILFCKNNR